MEQGNTPDLVLCVPCKDDGSETWVLNPQERDSFRIVVRCEQGKSVIKRAEKVVHTLRHQKRWYQDCLHYSISTLVLQLLIVASLSFLLLVFVATH